jgi:hypothetical protein
LAQAVAVLPQIPQFKPAEWLALAAAEQFPS